LKNNLLIDLDIFIKDSTGIRLSKYQRYLPNLAGSLMIIYAHRQPSSLPK